jgi:hypothetical protein
MTDVIKDFDQKESDKVMKYLSKNKPFEKENARLFREELNDLGIDKPTIIAFGGDAHTILTRNFKNEYKILKIPHYSNYGSKEKYREEVKSILQFE